MTIHERQLQSQELGIRRNIGVGSLIVNMDGKIYTVRELKGNKDTERLPNQVAISTEKRKGGGEDLRSNLLGALGEFCSDKDMSALREHLFIVGPPRIRPVQLDGKSLACSLMTLVCDINIQPTPAHVEEVIPNGWITVSEAFGLTDLRSLSRQLLNVIDRERLVEKGIENFRNNVGKAPVLEGFGSNKSFDRFIRERNLLQDSYTNGAHSNGFKNHR